MATPAQIAADLANVQHSSGSRTKASKAITRKNASRHGLCSTIPGLYAEDEGAAKLLLAHLTEEHQPQGSTKPILVYSDNSKQISLLRYYTTAGRAFTKNLNEAAIGSVSQNAEAPPDPAESPAESKPQTTARTTGGTPVDAIVSSATAAVDSDPKNRPPKRTKTPCWSTK